MPETRGRYIYEGTDPHRILIIKKKIYANIKGSAKKAKVKKMS